MDLTAKPRLAREELFIGFHALRQAFGIVEPVNAQDQFLTVKRALHALDHLGSGGADGEARESIRIGADGESGDLGTAEIHRSEWAARQARRRLMLGEFGK